MITGAGTVNPLGSNTGATFDSLARGHCAIGPLDIPDVDRLKIKIGAQVRDWRPEDHFEARHLPLLDRAAQFALVSAAEALAQAGPGIPLAQAGCILGTAGGGLTTIDDNYKTVYQAGKDRVHPLVVPRLMPSAPVSQISLTHGLQGPCFTVSSACSSSNHAIGLAFQMVRSGMAPAMLAGGAEAMLCFGGLKAWEALRVMSPDGCRPFSADRNGMVQGEGAAVFVLEEREAALARGAHVLAEVLGFSMTSDAADIVLPSQEGAERVMRLALQDAGIAPDAIGYINAHGTGTAANDRIEAAAIRGVFGDHGPAVSSTKSQHGHLIGATGAVELLACLMALNGQIAPTASVQDCDPDCALDLVVGTARKADVSAVLTNSFAFGGLSACLVLGPSDR